MPINRTKIKRFWQDYQDNIVLAIAIVLLAGVVCEGRRRGGFEQLELLAYDRMLTQQPVLPSDDRLVLVEINEEDLRQQERWPFSDEVYAEVLEHIQAGDPAVVGLDVYRDFPVEPGYARLVEQLQQPNLIAIRNLDILTGTPAPPAVVAEQQGFNDVPLDSDGVLRRALLYATGSDQQTFPSFALNVAMSYLYEQEGIAPQASELDPQYLQLGEATFFPLEATSGGYQTMDARGYQMLFHYRDRHNLGQVVTFTDVWDKNFDSSILKDKIVLIGSTAPSLKDVVTSPFTLGTPEGNKMNGVVAHGQVISYVLDTALGVRAQFRFWREWQEMVWIVSWLAGGVVIGWWFRHPVAIVGGFLFGIVGTWGAGYFLLKSFIWIPVATPMISFAIAMGVVIVYQSYQDFRQQKMVMTLLGQNTSPAIADALWEERSELLTSGQLPGCSLTATMLFLDVRGFSSISEKMMPPDLLDWLNKMLGMITAEVQGRNGIVNKFTGDGIVAIFGVPVPRESDEDIAQDAQDCVSAAVAIAEKLTEINQTFTAQNLPKAKLRIGIFTGEVVAGSLGGKDRMEYGVIGDSVNTASRLESCAKERQPVDCRILIAEATQQYLDQKFPLEAWGPMPLKGKAEVVQVFRVLTTAELQTSTSVSTS
ncbi:adenylate/guanylate cyclase with Chase sensor [[Leptolyngbya] sp. PCC 7376]|uniref:CHASE2 domain-containing protein n=1 Tax=[Leptolyngbya] sp. PCC 7376 TaxID=111781 RepID=UPI00029F337A|nr:adenylate/guanylate cyclase domain-containing protein [[Leptolyngbya] sp. PCC 7376]AFY38557.1 adenylate/guanylate cyclase with Chase sensor [[Leptolyngbya] sp. PCC 7376]